jgi:hypothetical protein
MGKFASAMMKFFALKHRDANFKAKQPMLEVVKARANRENGPNF